ncbi:MAG: hypothetical protein LBS74_03365 [Oscillospiraceae bacterium]|jgi:putative endonuclease|nr:hypothetical protein [Oscillospiraceae bacterium]
MMFKPRNERSKYADSVTFEEAVQHLQLYLADKIEISTSAPCPQMSEEAKKRKRAKKREHKRRQRRAKRQREKAIREKQVLQRRLLKWLRKVLRQKENPPPLPCEKLSEAEQVFAGIALISSRIIAKYCKGQQPHHERMLVWERALYIIEELLEAGTIDKGEALTFARNGYVFNCNLYHTENVGDILLPVELPEYQQNTPDSQAEYKPLRFEGINKARARKYIFEYQLQRPDLPPKWHFVYIVKCADDTYYTDTAHDVGYAVYLHTNGQGSPYTKSRTPVKLCYFKAFSTAEEAAAYANKIRSYSKKRKQAISASQKIK